MDADRFDSLARALGLRAARRGIAAGLLGGGVASLAGLLQGDARSRRRDDELTAEKRKKKKKKRKKRKGKNQNPPPRDQAPPCTDTSCPLPPECAAQAVKSCSDALIAALQVDAQACLVACQNGDGPTCRECLEPILAPRLPVAQSCVAQACLAPPSRAMRREIGQEAAEVSIEAWWQRSCDKPTCCYVSQRDCQDDATEGFFECMAAGVAAAIASGGLASLGAVAICIAKLVYQMEKCRARYGCPEGSNCAAGDICCPYGEIGCDSGGCCRYGTHCCPGGGCCHDGDTCCFRQSSQTLFCCPPGAQCMQTGIPCCSNCG